MKKDDFLTEYKAGVYPRTLWVAVLRSEEDIEFLKNKFIFKKLDRITVSDTTIPQLKKQFEEKTSVAVTVPVEELKDNGRIGVLIIIISIESADTGSISHESVHAADYIYDELHMYTQEFAENEQYAYLVGWVAGCVGNSIIKFNRDYEIIYSDI